MTIDAHSCPPPMGGGDYAILREHRFAKAPASPPSSLLACAPFALNVSPPTQLGTIEFAAVAQEGAFQWSRLLFKTRGGGPGDPKK